MHAVRSSVAGEKGQENVRVKFKESDMAGGKAASTQCAFEYENDDSWREVGWMHTIICVR